MKKSNRSTVFPSFPDPAQLEQWEKQYGSVHKIELFGKVAWLRKPTAKDLQQAEIAKQQHPALFIETILLNCFLTGDEAIKTVNVERLVPGSIGNIRTFELTTQMHQSGALTPEK